MKESQTLAALRGAIRNHTLASEARLARDFIAGIEMTVDQRSKAQQKAAGFVAEARANATRSGLIDKFLQEYGLSTTEGVTLMRLAEALLRTPDAATANILIEDKIEAGDWAAHKGKSPFPLVNFSTRALMLTAAWLDDEEARDPLRRMVRTTKAALDRLGEPVIRASVAQAMRVMGEHFVLGETIDAAIKRGRKFAVDGYLFSFDMLGEAALTGADAEKYFHDYDNAIAAIAAHAGRDKAADNPGISVKLSALHPRYEYVKKERVLKELGERTAMLARKARAANMGFNIDAEEADRLDISLDVIEQLMRDETLKDWDGFGVVVQAYQRRAPFVLEWLAVLSRQTGRRIMVRLVKGAYWDAEIKRGQVFGLDSYPVFTRKAMTDLSFIACARKILSATDAFYPQFATHNAMTATTVMEMAGDYTDYEFQRLHGMGEALHDSLLDHGARSRIYAPVGGHKELLPYLVRRLLENGANSSFVNQLIDPDLSVDDIVEDPIEEVAALSTISNPYIPAPRDHLMNGRPVAKGWDDTDPDTLAGLGDALEQISRDRVASPIVNGEQRRGDHRPVASPTHSGMVVGAVSDSTAADIDDACRAAAAFAAEWAARTAAERAQVLETAADLLEKRGALFMSLCVLEAGKTWPDAIAEIREAVDFLRYYARQAQSLEGLPLGVVACISPWNFPLAIFLGQVSACLAAGNCVIAKPAEQTPLIASEGVKLLHDAGAPAGALHFLPGDGLSVGAPLVANPAIAGVVFTGSTAAAQAINRTLTERAGGEVALIAETGGINAMIIDSTALLEQAVADSIDSAFQSAGQRCSACRLVCVQEDIFPRFEEMLIGAIAELRIGDPALFKTDVGPVIDQEAKDNLERHIEKLDKTARLIARAGAVRDEATGAFVLPAAYEIGAVSDLGNEIFGPVLHVTKFAAGDLISLVDEINALGYGLTMGVHTRIDETMHAISQRARIGNLYVNRNQIGAIVGVQPFGGEAMSGTGPKAGGPHYLHALVKAAPPVGEGSAQLKDETTSAGDQKRLSSADHAYRQWLLADRQAIVVELSAALSWLSADQRSALAALTHATAGNEELPGPTGESNTLRLRGRGVAALIGAGNDDMEAWSALRAIAAGNAVIAPDTQRLRTLETALVDAGAPQGLLTLIGGPLSTGLLLNDTVRLALYDGAPADLPAIHDCLAKREGPIIPVASQQSESWRLSTERTLSINTTAAGGDVRLLSLGE